MAYPKRYAISEAAASVEPISSADVAAHRRITGSDEAASEADYLTGLCAAAREWAENFTRRAFVNRVVTLKLDCFPRVIDLPKPPLVSVASIAYVDSNGSSQTVSAATYTVDTTSQPGRVYPAYGEDWPTDVRDQPHAVTVTYTAGYGAGASSVPYAIRAALLMLAGHWYETREPVVVGSISTKIPFSVESLLLPFKIPEFS